MNSAPPSGQGRLWAAGLLLTGAILGLSVVAFALVRLRPGTPLPQYGQVHAFMLTNQDARAVTQASLAGQVWIADIVFTRCAGPCPRMTRLMKQIQDELRGRAGVRLVSFTADPAYDQPAVLRQYAQRFGADVRQWDFLTGPKSEIARLATNDLKLVLVENDPAAVGSPDELFLHSTKLVLVDPLGRLRGYYDGENPAARGQIVAAARRLLREK